MKEFFIVAGFFAIILGFFCGLVHFDHAYNASEALLCGYKTMGEIPPQELGNYCFNLTFLLLFIKWTVDVAFAVGEVIFKAANDA